MPLVPRSLRAMPLLSGSASESPLVSKRWLSKSPK
jgi:hypothetical protein